MKRFRFVAGLALAVMAIVALGGPAAAGEPTPFKGRVRGVLTNRVPFPAPPVFLDTIEMTGRATHLGAFELREVAVVDFGVAPPYAEGEVTFVAANGDTLTAEFQGSSEPVEAGIVLITENATITGGTGRFAGATGSHVCKRLFSTVTGKTVGYFEGTISVPGR